MSNTDSSVSKNGKNKGEVSAVSPAILDAAEGKKPALFLLLEDIKVDDAFNVRQHYTEEEIKELANSIKESKGIETPLTVREYTPGKFSLVSGFRRVKALRLLGWKEPVPVVLGVYKSDVDAWVRNVVENAARRDVRPFDLAKRLSELKEKGAFKTEQLSTMTTYQPDYINNMVRAFNQLHPTILAFWADPSAEVQLPAPKAITWAGLGSHDEQLKRFNEWKQLKEIEAAEKKRKLLAKQAKERGEVLPSEETEVTGEGAAVRPPAPIKPPTRKQLEAKADELKTKLSEERAEGKAGDANAAQRAEETKIQLATLRWVIGKRASL